MKESEKKEVHIIYGYQERGDGWRKKGLSHPRWYIGITHFSRWKKRHINHRYNHRGLKSHFPNFIRKRLSEGKSFDEILEMFHLETFFGTRHDAELRELHYTNLFDAMSPNGFVDRGGCYGGLASGETKSKLRIAQNKRWEDPEERRKISISAKKTWANPELRSMQSDSHKERFKCPVFKEKHRKSINTDEAKRKHRENYAKAMNKPGVRERHSLAVKKARNRPDVYERNNDAIRMSMNRPEVKDKMRRAQKITQNRPEVKAKIKKTCSTPEYKKMHRNACVSRFNNREIIEKHLETYRKKNPCGMLGWELCEKIVLEKNRIVLVDELLEECISRGLWKSHIPKSAYNRTLINGYLACSCQLTGKKPSIKPEDAKIEKTKIGKGNKIGFKPKNLSL